LIWQQKKKDSDIFDHDKNAKRTKLKNFIIAIMLFTVSATGLSQTFSETDFRLSAGDAIRVLIYDGSVVPENSRYIYQFHDQEYILDGYGEIRLSSLGKIKIVGKSVDEIQKELENIFRSYAKEPHVIVIPLIKVVLRGEFGMGGMYRFSLNTSFWDLVSTAGGISNSYSLENMYLARNGDIFYKNFTNAFYQAQSLSELGIQSGDEIVSPRINRISMASIMRYFQFASSIVLLYLAFSNTEK
jgi:protein involved in polysaccharide export with SLBB domain